MSFVKLDCGLLDSTLWSDTDGTRVFITALLMARPKNVTVPTVQIEVRTLKLTGFEVPPGWYGFVSSAGVGIIRRAGMENEMEAGLSALERLGSAEEQTRTSGFEGRRLVRVDGGYVVLNYWKYRQKDHTAAARAKKYRAKKGKSAKSVKSDGQSRERRYEKALAAGNQALADSIAAEGLPFPNSEP